jgi:hypothetical protein
LITPEIVVSMKPLLGLKEKCTALSDQVHGYSEANYAAAWH